MTSLYPRSQIDISILVLEQDGGAVNASGKLTHTGVLAAAINATTLALINAGISLSSPVAALSLCCLHDVPLLDPCAPEETDLPTATIASLAGTPPRVTLVQLESRLSIDRFEGMLRLAAEACTVIAQEMREAVMDSMEDAAERLGRYAAGQQAPRPSNTVNGVKTGDAMQEDD